MKVTRLRVRMKDMVPTNSKQAKQCYLAISVSNPLYKEQKKIKKIIEWINKRYSSCIILIGDFLNRFNEIIFNNVNPEQAIVAANKLGDQIEEYFVNALEFYPSTSFSIRRWEPLFQNDLVQQRKSCLYRKFESHLKFKQRIIEHSEFFLSKQSDKGKKIIIDDMRAMNLSTEYILEELAVFSLLVEEGYKVQIYPGTSLMILKELASGKITDVDLFLEDGCYIDISI